MSYTIDLSKDDDNLSDTKEVTYTEDHDEPQEEGIPPSYQFRALSRKNASLQVNKHYKNYYIV